MPLEMRSTATRRWNWTRFRLGSRLVQRRIARGLEIRSVLNPEASLPSEEVLREQAYLVARGVRPLSLAGHCHVISQSDLLLRMATHLERDAEANVIPSSSSTAFAQRAMAQDQSGLLLTPTVRAPQAGRHAEGGSDQIGGRTVAPIRPLQQRYSGSVDPRLRLHNAVLGLAHHSAPRPCPLGEVGYQVVRIEQPVTTEAGRVAVDLVFAARERNALLAVECKDGTVQDQQASRYQAMRPVDLIRTASISLPDSTAASLDVAYAVWGEQAPTTVARLAAVAPRVGTLSIDAQISWLGAVPVDVGLRSAFADSHRADLRAIPRLMLADDSSPAAALALAVANELQAALEDGRESITVSTLVERACWGWPRFGRAFQGRLVKQVAEMLRAAQGVDLGDLIAVERPARENPEHVVSFVARESEAATQAGELRGARAVRNRLDAFVGRVTGHPVPPTPGQLDLLSELGDLDTEDDE